MAKAYSKEQSTYRAEREKKEVKKPKQIPKRSAKRIREDVEYHSLRFVFLLSNSKCQICNIATSQQVHHKFSGKDRSKYYLDVSTWMALCHDCHSILHLHPKESREKGYLK
jgi:NADH pyrophosphatase NudC (nudix superfamily)